MGTSTKPGRGGRAPIARHGELQTRHPIIQFIAMLAVALGVVGVSAVGVAAFTVADAAVALGDNSISLPEEEQLPPSLGAIEGGVNLLVVGTDSCEGPNAALSGACMNRDTAGERNDVTMLVHISDDPRRVTVVSFPRDMVVPIPSCPDGEGGNYSAMTAQPLNASYMYGGLACTAMTIEALTGEKVHFAAAMRWTGVINMSDAIGGVGVCVTGEINDPHTGIHLTEGRHNLKGTAALQFLRVRHGIGDGSDLGRISNQQQFMSSMVRTLQSDGVLGNPATLFGLATTAITQVTQKQLVMSQGLANPTRMAQIAMAVKDVPYEDIVFVQYPTYYQPGNGRSDVMPVRGDGDILFAALRDNAPLNLTGESSQGYGVEVTGEVTKPAPTPTATPSSSPSGSPSATPTETAIPEARVDMPSSIAGQTAAQVTCTRPQQ